MSTSMASPYKSLEVWVKHFFGYLVYEIFILASVFVYVPPTSPPAGKIAENKGDNEITDHEMESF